MKETSERDYVLGTHDEEIQRLGLQHFVWRPRALDGWRRAGFTTGHTLLDIGCGPGWASIDLARIAGPGGRVVACDRSRRFLDALEAARDAQGLRQIEAHAIDLDEATPLPATGADGAWCRWVLAFVQRPRDLLARIHAALRPGAVLVAHEYLDYRTWRLAPRSEVFEHFVRTVVSTWQASGGEPDVGMDLPRWLEAAGFRIREQRPLVDVIEPRDYLWQWPRAFVASGAARLRDLGALTPEQTEAIAADYARAAAAPGTRMVTPTVIEVLAERV